MAAPNTHVADGTLPHGSFDITILETGQAYVADNFQGDQDAKVIRSNNKVGAPRRQKIIVGPWDGSCDLQMEEASTPRPEPGQFFVADADGDGTPEPYMVTKAGVTFTADDAVKCKASITRALNPVIFASAGKTTPELAAGITYASSSAITAITLGVYLPAGQAATTANPWSATGLPAGLTISTSTGAISGTPTTPGVSVVKVKCSATLNYTHNGVLVTETRTGERVFKITIT